MRAAGASSSVYRLWAAPRFKGRGLLGGLSPAPRGDYVALPAQFSSRNQNTGTTPGQLITAYWEARAMPTPDSLGGRVRIPRLSGAKNRPSLCRAGFIGRRARSWICRLVSPRSSQRPAGPPFRRALPWPPSVECGAAGPASRASFYETTSHLRNASREAWSALRLLTKAQWDCDRYPQ